MIVNYTGTTNEGVLSM